MSTAAEVSTAATFLFVPGDRPDRFSKATSAGADVVVLDLEDAVAADDKARARVEVLTWLRGGGRGCVRVNASGEELARDLAALTPSDGVDGLLGIMVAKADRASISVVSRLTGVPLLALIESAAGVSDVQAVAAHPQVTRLVFGHLDYAVDIGAQPSRTAMLHARSALVLASRSAGLAGAVDGVSVDVHDESMLVDDVRHASELGMTGKLLIHPRQVGPTHRALTPDAGSIEWARRVLSVGTRAVAQVDGQMVDAPVLARAAEILRRVGAAG